MKFYKKYSDIPQKYRFDLDSLLENDTIENLIDKYLKQIYQELKYKDSKYESPEKFLEFKKLEQENDLLYNRIFNYLSNKSSLNVVDEKINKLIADFELKVNEFQKENGSELNRAYQNLEKLSKWKDLESFSLFKSEIEDLIEYKKHKLPDQIEDYLIKAAKGESDLSNIFNTLTNSEIDFGYAISSSGKKYKITEGTYPQNAKNKDRQVRKTNYQNYLDGFYRNKETLSLFLKDHFYKASTDAKLRNYNSSIEMLIYEDKMKTSILEQLFKNVSSLKREFSVFSKLQDKFFKAKFNEKREVYDASVDLTSSKNKFSIKEAQDIYLKAIEPLGKEYIEVSKRAFDENWIDYMSVDNKVSGAYSIGDTYGLDKMFILMNWNYTLDSVSTLAHEMGHSMHSYFSNKKQPYQKAEYPIFLAEIASIFNELMLNDYLLKTSKNKEFKFQILSEMIKNFQGTVFKQTMWANYEYELYSRIDQNIPFANYSDFESLYNEVAQKYTKNKLKKSKSSIYSVIVPHFYYGFYVYKYAIGFLVAYTIFNRYKNGQKDALNVYIDKFLSAGGHKPPLEILKDIDINLEDPELYNQPFEILRDNIKEYKKLGEEIFKTKRK
ncbi:oligoendopeptidase F [Mycoplasma procyoni]|uniref:oligoendopeptidase F n=1 Tax=Mycoplasma procyoni TaxID=568784 RepID=UPI00197C9752|nr:oligoendopeptidase F [Mycoplasma procyoni]MBN3534615.1 oligoendopeptidase F [Mycoplasma procyoni]